MHEWLTQNQELLDREQKQATDKHTVDCDSWEGGFGPEADIYSKGFEVGRFQRQDNSR